MASSLQGAKNLVDLVHFPPSCLDLQNNASWGKLRLFVKNETNFTRRIQGLPWILKNLWISIYSNKYDIYNNLQGLWPLIQSNNALKTIHWHALLWGNHHLSPARHKNCFLDSLQSDKVLSIGDRTCHACPCLHVEHPTSKLDFLDGNIQFSLHVKIYFYLVLESLGSNKNIFPDLLHFHQLVNSPLDWIWLCVLLLHKLYH